MLRTLDTAAWARRATLFGWRYFLVERSREGSATWRSSAFRRLEREQWTRPVALFERGRRCYWTCEGQFFWEDEGLRRSRCPRACFERGNAGNAADSNTRTPRSQANREVDAESPYRARCAEQSGNAVAGVARLRLAL